MPWCPYHPDSRNKWALRKNVQDTCCIDIKTVADNRGRRVRTMTAAKSQQGSETFVAEKNIKWLHSTRVKRGSNTCFVLQKLKFYVCPLIVDRNQPISARELTQSDCKKNRTFKNGVASVIRDFYFTPLYLMLLSGYVLWGCLGTLVPRSRFKIPWVRMPMNSKGSINYSCLIFSLPAVSCNFIFFFSTDPCASRDAS